MSASTALRRVAPFVLVALGALGLWLVVAGSDDDTTADSGPIVEIESTDAEAVAELAALEIPGGAQDFLTARLDDDTQLDITFTIDPADEAAFIEGSALPDPSAGQRTITHSSPLWELSPSSEVRGSDDSVGELRRRIELVEEDGRVRVRAVLTPDF